MSITTYAELQTAVASWLERDNLSAQIPDLILMGEKWIFRNARIRDMEATLSATISTDDTHLKLPGVGGNYASTPSNPNIGITSDIDIRLRAAMEDWTPLTSSILIAKWLDSGGGSFLLRVNSNGTVQFFISGDGTTSVNGTSTSAVGATNGAATWVRVTRVASSGLTQFFTSSDGTAWTQLGTDVTISAGLAIFDSTTELSVGAYNSGSGGVWRGKVYQAELRNGVDGVVVAKFQAEKLGPSGGSSDTEEAWTINRSGTQKARIVPNGTATVPDDFITPKHARLSGSPTRSVKFRTPSWIYETYPTRSSDSKPFFIGVDGDRFVFGPYPDSAYVVNGIYYRRLTSIASVVNLLFESNPDLYLFASLCEAEPFIKNDKRLLLWQSKRDGIIAAINNETRESRYASPAMELG